MRDKMTDLVHGNIKFLLVVTCIVYIDHVQDTLSLVYFPKTYQINVKPIFIKSICTKGYSGKIFSKRMAVMLKPKIVLSIFLYIYKIKSFLNYTIKNG